MPDSAKEKQGGNSPRQLELFGVDEFVEQVIRRDNFSEDVLKYFKKGEIPPNDKDRYYFGVEFDDKEHGLLITIFKKPKDVLDFYLQVWKNNESGRLDEMTEIFDRNEVDAFVREILSDRYAPMINGDLIISAAKKIVNKLKKDTQLFNIIKKYEKISAQKKREEVHSGGSGGKNNKGGEYIKRSGNGMREERLNKGEVIEGIGGWDKVWGSVDRATARLYAQNQGQKNYVWKNIITEDWIENFVNEIVGVKNLLPAEKKMIKEIVKWAFDKKKKEEMGSTREY
jgi:hypothetical protein